MNFKSAIRVCTYIAIVALMSSTVAWGAPEIFWGANEETLYKSDGETLVTGHHTDNGLGGFVQLLWLGSDGVYNELTLSGTGTSGDDEVIATSWVGQNTVFLVDPHGWFTGDSVLYETEDKYFIIRFFEEPSPDYAGGLIPLTGHYGISDVFAGTDALMPDTFQITDKLEATTLVPEPGAAVMMLIGAGVVMGLRRKRTG